MNVLTGLDECSSQIKIRKQAAAILGITEKISKYKLRSVQQKVYLCCFLSIQTFETLVHVYQSRTLPHKAPLRSQLQQHKPYKQHSVGFSETSLSVVSKYSIWIGKPGTIYSIYFSYICQILNKSKQLNRTSLYVSPNSRNPKASVGGGGVALTEALRTAIGSRGGASVGRENGDPNSGGGAKEIKQNGLQIFLVCSNKVNCREKKKPRWTLQLGCEL